MPEPARGHHLRVTTGSNDRHDAPVLVVRPSFRACLVGIGIPAFLVSQFASGLAGLALSRSVPWEWVGIVIAVPIGVVAAVVAWRRTRAVLDPAGITAHNLFTTWTATWDEIDVIGIKNLDGGPRFGYPSVIAAAISGVPEPKNVTATLCFGLGSKLQATNLARVRSVSSDRTEVLTDDADVGDEWYRRRWQRREPHDPHAGYFDM